MDNNAPADASTKLFADIDPCQDSETQNLGCQKAVTITAQATTPRPASSLGLASL